MVKVGLNDVNVGSNGIIGKSDYTALWLFIFCNGKKFLAFNFLIKIVFDL